MRVLWVVEAAGGGTARHVLDLSRGLASRGVEVHLFYNPRRTDAVWERERPLAEASGVRFFPLPMRAAPDPADLARILALRRHLARKGPFALVHGHSSKGGALARLLRAAGGPPAVYTPHAFASLCGGGLCPLFTLAERALVPWTDALIAVSPEEAVEAHRLGYPRPRVHMIPNGLDPAAFRPLPRDLARRRMGLPAGVPVVGFLGRLDRQKDPGLLLTAFARVRAHHPGALLVFAGEGPFRSWLERRAARLGLYQRVRFLGFRSPEEALPAFDLLALPSRYEGFPYVLLEALAAGLPVVATRVGGATLAVADGESGFLVPAGDADALARALSRLLGTPLLRARMGRAARERARRFTRAQMVAATLDLYRRLYDRFRR